MIRNPDESGHFVVIDPGSSGWLQVVTAIRGLMEPRL
jgi:hypothetical protein